MRTIVVDDEQLMLKRFVRLSKGIADLNLVGQFECAADAVAYARENPAELAWPCRSSAAWNLPSSCGRSAPI